MPDPQSPATPASAPAGARPDRPFSWRFTTPLFLSSALNPINSSLIATALVPIAHGLHVPVGQTAALVIALYLASAIAQPTAGKSAGVFIGLGTSCAYPTAMLLIRRRAFDAGLVQPPGGILGGLQIAGIATASLGLP